MSRKLNYLWLKGVNNLKIGVLAVQGAFKEHEQMLDICGASHFQIRQKSDLLQPLDGLILPGGESTVQGKLLKELNMLDTLKYMISNGLPVFGTCAGLILLANHIENDSSRHIGCMDITAVRNAYGRQLGGFYTQGAFADMNDIPMTFIRAPYIKSVGIGVQILSEHSGKITAARSKNILVTAFHPELNNDTRVHQYFLDICKIC